MHQYSEKNSSLSISGQKQENRPRVNVREMPYQLMQHKIGNQATGQLIEGELHEQNKQLDEEEYTHASGLPSRFKQQIENLSGVSLDQVKVFYGSNLPAQLQAHAYAQGNEIHLAPDQERHLPHEAWHIVQQKQGKVKPTINQAGTLINDDPKLEQEATSMSSTSDSSLELQAATAAAQLMPNEKSPSQPVAQLARKTDNFSKNINEEERDKHDSAMTIIVDQIVTTVETARARALQWNDLESSSSKHLQNWYEVANSYCEDQRNLPSYFWANFGYAVETLACSELGASAFSPYKIQFQIAHGHTRPDIVITLNSEEIAWIDITSDGSEEHIKDKSGSGWTSRLFVYEVLYESLDPLELLSNSNNPYLSEYGDYLGSERSILDAKKEYVKNQWIQELVTYKRRNMPSDLRGGMKRREELTERFFAKKMGGNLTGTRFKRQAIRGGIKELGGSTAELGYKRNAKIDTHYIKRSIELEAIRKSERNKRLLNIRTQRTLDSDLSSLPEHPLKVEYKNTETPIIQRGRILQGMALKHGLMQLQLIEAYIEDTMSNTPAQIDEAKKLQGEFPDQLEVKPLSDWIAKAVRLLQASS